MEFDHKKDLNAKLLSDEEIADASPRVVNPGVSKEQPWWKCCAKLNNKTVLFIVCCLFACFASAEMAGAFVGSSLALLGDATASCVDVITYFTNLYAETIATPKSPPNSTEDFETPDYKHTSAAVIAENAAIDERTRLFHEVYVPTFSCVALIGVTIFIMIVASIEIASGGDDSADENVMFVFASINAVIDIICISMFYSRKDDIVHNKFPSFSAEPVIAHSPVSLHSVNINMFSAFTHIGSDTLRTLAVFGAAIVSSTTGAKSSICDAWAALVVSITIFFAIIPLATEVYAAYTGKR